MIHVTFSNGKTALFSDDEEVWVCEEIIAGEYIAGDYFIPAWRLKPGLFVLEGDELEPKAVADASIQKTRIL